MPKAGNPQDIQRLNTLLAYFDNELSREAVRASKSQIEKLALGFYDRVVKNASGYPDVASRLQYALSNQEPSVNVNVTGGEGFSGFSTTSAYGRQAKISIRHYNSRALDKAMPVYIKRNIKGNRKRYSRLKYSEGGWWRYFEYGSSDRNWGSREFGFYPAPGKRKGGRMLRVSDVKDKIAIAKDGSKYWKTGDKRFTVFDPAKVLNIQPHPGVRKLGMFARAWQEQRAVYAREIARIVTENRKNLTQPSIQAAADRAAKRFGNVGKSIQNIISSRREERKNIPAGFIKERGLDLYRAEQGAITVYITGTGERLAEIYPNEFKFILKLAKGGEQIVFKSRTLAKNYVRNTLEGVLRDA